ncbi:secreted effector protein [Salmonella sp. NCTC 11881]|nr:secreted effector protein [Salmonella sp. NCTC 11881]
MLAHEIDAVPAWNCKSGKDRTGMMDSEIKREIISLHQTHMLSAPGSLPDSGGQKIFQKVLLNSGNLEIQKQKYGRGGKQSNEKIYRQRCSIFPIKNEFGDENIWQSVKGISSLITS